ncbi:MAG: UDP-N-acetylglucosamine 2-epimerase [Planctomycetota bacterium]
MSDAVRTVAVVTGTRAELGLLRTTMHAVDAHPRLALRVVVAGAHLLPPEPTVAEVQRDFDVAARIEMQRPDRTGRLADARALGRGVAGMARCFGALSPDVVLVLGDRIEAFAAAAAASVGGIALAHLHGGDRAPGVADEAMRHAITKLAHVHLAATDQSAQRIVAMGEPPERVHVVGSPAIDGLADVAPLDDASFAALGSPRLVMLVHPIGRTDEQEATVAAALVDACRAAAPTLALHPNHDPGRNGILRAIEASGIPSRAHLPRSEFVGLLRRVDALVGNSSAGLIEASALRVPCVNVGPRQSGRERGGNVIDVEDEDPAAMAAAIGRACKRAAPAEHPFGDGRTGRRVADLLAELAIDAAFTRKRNAY